MTVLRVVEAFAVRARGTAIVVDFTDDGTVRAGDVACVRLVSGEVRETLVGSVDFVDGRDADGGRSGKVALRVDEIAPDEIALDAILETRRP